MKKIVKKILYRFGYDVKPLHRYGLSIGYPEIKRFLYFRRMYEQIVDIEGDIVECGIGGGQSFIFLAFLVKEEMEKRKLWGFDSFEGFPDTSENDKSIRDPKRGQNKTNVLDFYKLLFNMELSEEFLSSQLSIVRGFFSESLKNYTGNRIALLHIDVDLYESYLAVLEELYPKVTNGGIILFDEYINSFENIKFPGAKKAIDEYFSGQKINMSRDDLSGKFYVVKP